MKQLKKITEHSNKLNIRKSTVNDETVDGVPYREIKEKNRAKCSTKTNNLTVILSATGDENKTSYSFKKAAGFNDEEACSFDQEIKTRVDEYPEEIKDISPEDVVIEQAEQDKIGVGYGALIKKDPAQAGAVLLDFAKQKYGLSDEGKEINGAGMVILNKKIDSAVTKAFPGKKYVIEIINKMTRQSTARRM